MGVGFLGTCGTGACTSVGVCVVLPLESLVPPPLLPPFRCPNVVKADMALLGELAHRGPSTGLAVKFVGVFMADWG